MHRYKSKPSLKFFYSYFCVNIGWKALVLVGKCFTTPVITVLYTTFKEIIY